MITCENVFKIRPKNRKNSSSLDHITPLTCTCSLSFWYLVVEANNPRHCCLFTRWGFIESLTLPFSHDRSLSLSPSSSLTDFVWLFFAYKVAIFKPMIVSFTTEKIELKIWGKQKRNKLSKHLIVATILLEFWTVSAIFGSSCVYIYIYAANGGISVIAVACPTKYFSSSLTAMINGNAKKKKKRKRTQANGGHDINMIWWHLMCVDLNVIGRFHLLLFFHVITPRNGPNHSKRNKSRCNSIFAIRYIRTNPYFGTHTHKHKWSERVFAWRNRRSCHPEVFKLFAT